MPGEPGATDIAAGGIVAAVVSFAATGLHVLGEGFSQFFAAGPSIFRLSTGFSLALLGAGYLVGISAGLAMMLGAILAWGVAVPILTALHPMPAGGDIATYATGLWAHQVRFMGAGTIAVAAIWSLVACWARPSRACAKACKRQAGRGGVRRRATDQDMAPRWIGIVFLGALLAMAATFAAFLSGAAPVSAIFGLVAYGCVFATVFGFLVAAACGYMAGLVGSSSSPISGIAINRHNPHLAASAGDPGHQRLLASEAGKQTGIALALFTVSVVLATATVSNDNLQDLKTASWSAPRPGGSRRRWWSACVVGALVIPPVPGTALQGLWISWARWPAPRWTPAQALAAPQATLMAAIARGIFGMRWTGPPFSSAFSAASC